jgi:hypothetical protein
MRGISMNKFLIQCALLLFLSIPVHSQESILLSDEGVSNLVIRKTEDGQPAYEYTNVEYSVKYLRINEKSRDVYVKSFHIVRQVNGAKPESSKFLIDLYALSAAGLVPLLNIVEEADRVVFFDSYYKTTVLACCGAFDYNVLHDYSKKKIAEYDRKYFDISIPNTSFHAYLSLLSNQSMVPTGEKDTICRVTLFANGKTGYGVSVKSKNVNLNVEDFLVEAARQEDTVSEAREGKIDITLWSKNGMWNGKQVQRGAADVTDLRMKIRMVDYNDASILKQVTIPIEKGSFYGKAAETMQIWIEETP